MLRLRLGEPVESVQIFFAIFESDRSSRRPFILFLLRLDTIMSWYDLSSSSFGERHVRSTNGTPLAVPVLLFPMPPRIVLHMWHFFAPD